MEAEIVAGYRRTSLTLSPLPTHNPDGLRVEYTCRASRGTFLGGGSSGIVELLPNGTVSKSPWPGEDYQWSRREIQHEARVYERIRERFGCHERFPRLVSFEEKSSTIIMEYMSTGTLRGYLQTQHLKIGERQRHGWLLALAEGMDLIHSANIFHGDFTPKNMLLNADLELKIADFGSSSMDGSQTNGCGSVRFYPPGASGHTAIDLNDDLFALGSCIFEVITGKPPYEDFDTPRVRSLYNLKQYPDLAGVDFAEEIRDCWHGTALSASDIHHRILNASALRQER